MNPELFEVVEGLAARGAKVQFYSMPSLESPAAEQILEELSFKDGQPQMKLTPMTEEAKETVKTFLQTVNQKEKE